MASHRPDASLADDLARSRRLRSFGLALGFVSALLLGLGKYLAGQPGQTQATVAALVAAAVALLASVALTAWGTRESRRLQARRSAGTRAGAGLRRATRSGVPEVDTRFTDPASRKGYGRRRWLLFLAAFVFLALAEFQYTERGNLPMAAVYAGFGLGSLGYALVLRHRLRLAR